MTCNTAADTAEDTAENTAESTAEETAENTAGGADGERGLRTKLGQGTQIADWADVGCRMLTSMSALRTATASLVFGIALSASSIAWADIPPVEPEPDCSVESEQAKGLSDCQQCDTYHAEPHKCEALSKDGLHKSCQGGGASVWHEVWCKGDASGPPAEQKPSGCGACTTTGAGSDSNVVWLALGLCLAGVAARRRRS